MVRRWVLMTGKARWGRPTEALLLAVIAALPEGWNSKLVFHNEPDGVSVRLSDGPPIQYSVAPQVCCLSTDILTPSHLNVWLGFWRSGLQGQSPGVNFKYIKSRRKGINLQRKKSLHFLFFVLFFVKCSFRNNRTEWGSDIWHSPWLTEIN